MDLLGWGNKIKKLNIRLWQATKNCVIDAKRTMFQLLGKTDLLPVMIAQKKKVLLQFKTRR